MPDNKTSFDFQTAKFNPASIEPAIFQVWIKTLSQRSRFNDKKKKITILLPPPNITGEMHLGHAWNCYLQDFLFRYYWLLDYQVTWWAGMDHAGIATQTKIEKMWPNSKLSADDLRTRIQEHTRKIKPVIIDQWKKLGLLLDPLVRQTPVAFTMDRHFSKAINDMFIALYHQGLVYRGQRVVMWDMQLKTALSNIEINAVVHDKKLYFIRYYAVHDRQQSLVVATSRPETMFADQALVVHPQDDRYQSLIGQQFINPVNQERLPLIASKLVISQFGTGVLKCTPGHDQKDWIIGQQHQLPTPSCIDPITGLMNTRAGIFTGQTVINCRNNLVNWLQQKKILVKTTNYQGTSYYSQRTQTEVVPIISHQWFVKTKLLAQKIINWQASSSKTIFWPLRFAEHLKQWLLKIEDWCISRQIVWGHRMPIWHSPNNTAEIYVGNEPPQDFLQVKDVFDTWFSSALSLLMAGQTKLPAANTLPNNYCTFLVTGRDIIFFWIARMMLFNVFYTNKTLFENIIIHGLVRDQQGRKMSKSLGNGINPLVMIDRYGNDSLRLFLLTATTPGLDINFNDQKIISYYHFLNKLWNAIKFVRYYCLTDREIYLYLATTRNNRFEIATIFGVVRYDNVWDYWIIYKLMQSITKFHYLVRKYELSTAFTYLKKWFLDDWCDWYLEIIKIKINKNKHRFGVLLYCMRQFLKVLHPFAPFTTDFLYQQLFVRDDSILNLFTRNIDKLPQFNNEHDDFINFMQEIITKLRHWKAQHKVLSKKIFSFWIVLSNDTPKYFLDWMHQSAQIFLKFCQGKIIFQDKNDPCGVWQQIDGKFGSIFILADHNIDWVQELADCQSQLQKNNFLLQKNNFLLQNQHFLKKAPAIVITKKKKLQQQLQQQQVQLKQKIIQVRGQIAKITATSS